jgi:alpha,alpha-trehalase
MQNKKYYQSKETSSISVKFFKKIIVSIIFILITLKLIGQISPDEEYGELFKTVQLSSIFKDSKTFPDAVPLYSPPEILRRYNERKSNKKFNLKEFILKHFQIPQVRPNFYKSNTSLPIEEHIEKIWRVLTRHYKSDKGSLIGVPYPYVVPGGRFDEFYYWDSYFSILGLKISGKVELIENTVDNFSFLIRKMSFIPNGNRSYFSSRSQPPFYSLMLSVLSELKGKSVLKKYLTYMEKEYRFWMDGTKRLKKGNSTYRRVVLLPGGEILNRYWDDKPLPRPEAYKEDIEVTKNSKRNETEIYLNIRAACESGWDFSSRWFKDQKSMETIHTTEIIPVDLNSLLYHLEMKIAEAYGLIGEQEEKEYYSRLANNRKLAIKKYCWNKREKFFMDYDFVRGENTGVKSLAALYPLFLKFASKKEAKDIAYCIKKKFLKKGGLVTTLNNTGEQWDSPNGWAPLQWIGVKGLRNYGYNVLAETIRRRWITLNIRVYKNTGKMMEKYNVVNTDLMGGGGEYALQDGFGWTNGVFLILFLEND